MLKVLEIRLILRYQPLQKPEHVALYIRVRVLIDRHRARRMLRKQRANPFAAFIPYQFLNLRVYLNHFLPVF